MGGSYKHATDLKAPHVRQCVDPFHVIQMANEVLNALRMAAWQKLRPKPGPKRPRGRPRKGTEPPRPDPKAAWIKHTRWALVKDPAKLSEAQWEVLRALQRERSALYRGWQLKEGLRDLYRLADRADAPAHLAWWLAWASRSRIPGFVALAKTVRANRGRILAAVELGLSNSKLEGLNSKVRLINHRGYGHHSAAALIAMIYLCAGGITIELPLR
jgi:transposase